MVSIIEYRGFPVESKVTRAIGFLDRALGGRPALANLAVGYEIRKPIVQAVTGYAEAHPDLENRAWPDLLDALIDHADQRGLLSADLANSLRGRAKVGRGVINGAHRASAAREGRAIRSTWAARCSVCRDWYEKDTLVRKRARDWVHADCA